MAVYSKSFFSHIRRYGSGNPLLITGVILLISLVSGALILPYLYPHYEKTSLENILQSPSCQFPFGTDSLGRCMMARTLMGIRLSLLIAVTASIIDVLLGVFWATLALFLGKKCAFFMMRMTDILFSIPRIPIIILLLVVFHHGVLPLIFAMILTGWIPISRIVYGQFLLLENKGFVLSAKSMEASSWHILRWHLLPNTFAPIISTLIFTIPNAIYTEAFISFLGLGIQPPQASLGTLVREGISAMDYYPWLFFIPSFFMIALSVSFNLIGEGVKTFLTKETMHA